MSKMSFQDEFGHLIEGMEIVSDINEVPCVHVRLFRALTDDERIHLEAKLGTEFDPDEFDWEFV